ncbi:dnaJ homolog subfamily C member 24 [Esox lucius]|uniref:DPH4 homolog n=1 Tax=Esox lucius TaxID=8010 RepID=C1BYP8_ESOLU|nr:dnaJ homolog subfamily C member 24 [Esox lucius]ACO14151.1 DPH4 homolog [Esox lucius]
MTNKLISQNDWYSILEASPSDELQDLKQKYQRLALLYHPDKQGPDVTVTEAEEHLRRFIEVDQAWKVLSNQETKRAYDLQLRASELNQSWPVDARVCLDDMTWDEDNEVYTYSCRCGGEFSTGREEADGAIVCCDTCSLGIEVNRTNLTGCDIVR